MNLSWQTQTRTHTCGKCFYTYGARQAALISIPFDLHSFYEYSGAFFGRDFGIGTFASIMRYWSIYTIRWYTPTPGTHAEPMFAKVYLPAHLDHTIQEWKKFLLACRWRPYSPSSSSSSLWLHHMHSVFVGISFRKFKTPEWLHPFERINFESMNHTAPCERRCSRWCDEETE